MPPTVHHATDQPPRDPTVDQDGSTLRPANAPPAHAGASGATDAEGHRDERLGEAIEVFLERAEGGQAPDLAEFAASYPDLREDLIAALEGLALVKGLVGGPSGPGHRLEEGRRVAGYRIVREIGRGGMGIVYEAVHVGLDRPVALKVLGSQATPDSSGRRRFLNEARTAAGLHHTHIVPVFDVGQVGGLCYYAMQRIEGSGLDRVLKTLRRDRTVAAGSTAGSTLRPGKARSPGTTPRVGEDARPIFPPLPVLGDETLSWTGSGPRRPSRWLSEGDGDRDEAPTFAPPRGSSYYRWVARVGQQAAEALAHAHQRGIIHRDIKPSNLLVDARGTVWVADFGLARRLADPSQTQVDSLLGTPRYMSPEQARTGAIDGRADVYSLGATLYELITLRPPFDGQSAAELIDQITGCEVVRPRRFDARVPLDLETILLKALAKRPVDRYAGAAELAADLGRFLTHEPVRARRIGPLGRAWRFARRHPGASTVSALAASVVLTTATVAYVHIVHARNDATDALKSTEVAVAELRVRNQELQAAALDNLEKQAANTRLTATTNRRADGLALIRQAVALARQMTPNSALGVRLRDQAVAFLATRDVQERTTIATPSQARRGLVFGPTGQRLAALDIDGELSVWDANQPSLAAESSRQAQTYPLLRTNRPGRFPNSFFPSSQGDRIARAGDLIAVVRPQRDGLWWFDLAAPDRPVGPPLLTPHQRVSSILASEDGRHLLVIGEPTTPERSRPGPDRVAERIEPAITLWDRHQPELPPVLLNLPTRRPDEGPSRSFLLAALAPDGSRVALAHSDDGRIFLWDGAGRPLEDGTGKPLDPILMTGSIRSLALGPSGLLAAADSSGEIALWDLGLSHPKQLAPLTLHQGSVNLLRFNPRDGATLAVASNDGVELWDLATRSALLALPNSEFVVDLAFAADGRTLAAAQAAGIALWSLIEPTAQVAVPESTDKPTSLAFRPDGALAIAALDGNFEPAPLQVWGGPDRCATESARWASQRPTTITTDALGRLICLAHEQDHDAVRWLPAVAAEPVVSLPLPSDPRPDRRGDRSNTGSPAVTLRPPSTLNPVRSPDGLNLLFVQRERINNQLHVRFSLWRQADGPTLKTLDAGDWAGDLDRSTFMVLAPQASHLFYLSRQKEALFCRPATERGFGRPDWSLPATGAVTLAIDPSGSTLALGFATGDVHLLDAATGARRATLPIPNKDDAGPALVLAFSPDGRTLAVGGRKLVRLWDVTAEPQPLVRLPGYRGIVRLLAFDPTGQRLAAADDKTVKVWNLDHIRHELERLGLTWSGTQPKKF